ncbi:MAG: DUF2490 domain-containing protein [Bacteroidetes bacterium]|nr:DUF2490 domain-containing protein [Bacteroidota bacterium]HET6244343.1 DUF2490 domain-containing protein [Bacteroidia bacterium]
MKKETVIILILLLFFWLGPDQVKSQNTQDFLIWSGLKLKKEIAPGTSINIRQEIRLRNNATEVQKGFIDVGIAYKFNKHLRIGMSYRNSQNVQRDFAFSSRHRLVTDLILKNEWKPIELSYRLRYQMNYKDMFSSENGRIPQQFLRHKIQANVELNKQWTPYAAVEFFNTMDEFPDTKWVQQRFKLGMDYSFNKYTSISVYYMLRTIQNINVPATHYILGTSVNIII